MKPRKPVDPESLAPLLRGSRLREPPDGTLRRAIALGTRLAPSSGGALEWLVSLVFDSAAQPLPAGVRAMAPAATERRLLYLARLPGGDGPEREIDLRVRRDPEHGLEIAGQILPARHGARVEARSGRNVRRADIGDDGLFVLRGLSLKSTSISLVISTPDGPELVVATPLPEAPADGSPRR